MNIFKSVFYPKKPLFIPSLTAYMKQSRLVLFIELWVRFIFFMAMRGGKVSTFSGKEGHIGRVIKHQYRENFNMMYFVRGRIEGLLYPLLSISSVRRMAKKAKVLSIGPRNEGEILLLSRLGFNWNNIVGADLFSYSPKILVMDMHDLDFPDNNFDVVISSWVLRYSYSIKKAISEIIRVAKNGSYVCIGFSWANEDFDKKMGDAESIGTKLTGGLAEILNYLRPNIETIHWQNEDSRENGADITLIFKIKK